jgi:hypothetical protein
MDLGRFRYSGVRSSFESNNAEIAFNLVDIPTGSQNLRILALAEKCRILMDESYSIILDSWSQLLDLVLQV